MKKKATSLFLALVLCLGLSTIAVHADVNALSSGQKFNFGSTSPEDFTYMLSGTFWIPESGLYSFTPYPSSQEFFVRNANDLYSLPISGTWYEGSFYVEFEADDRIYELEANCREIQYVIAEYHGKDASIRDDIFYIKDGILISYDSIYARINIPDTVTEIAQYVLEENFTNLRVREVIIPNSVTKIDAYAFSYCNYLESIIIPSSVVEIGENVFVTRDGSHFDDYIILPFLTVYGEAGSYAQTYCQKNNIPFQVIDLSTQPTTPTVTVENIPASGTAVASTQTVTVDGKPVEFQMYALLDENGNGTNYIKLRDMAHVLNGTKAQFSVGYSNEAGISATSGQPYQDTGSEMSTPFSGDRAYTGGGQSIQINGAPVEMTAISLLDDNGGGYTYFKLRDLGAALGFNVGWSAEQGIFVETE